jgi:diguanylate cyclase (GGDEF)-like protein/hemerythrin-like metal-binding protein
MGVRFEMTSAQPKSVNVGARSAAVLFAVGLLSSFGVYLGHEWFHTQFLPSLGIGAALGDALGGFAIILAAFIGQSLASRAIFHDIYFGLLRSAQTLQSAHAEMQAEMGELDRLASTDRLTGAWNRRRLEELISGEIDRLIRYDHALSMLIIDIDHFKSINDKHGHNAGDQVLVELTALLKTGLRTSDSLTRWGGEEFIVLCPSTPLTTAIVLAERLREHIAQAVFTKVGRVTVSVGVAECLIGEAWRDWLNRADAALYRAKDGGRNLVQFAPETPIHDKSSLARSAKLVHLTWHKAYESGLETIDREHQSLFSIANDLMNAMLAERPLTEALGLVDLLMQEVARHFLHEEAILAAINFPETPKHVELHRSLMSRAEQLAREFEAGDVAIGDFFQFMAQDVIAKHLLNADREFFPYLANKGN